QDGTNASLIPGDRVMLISLGEETVQTVNKLPLARYLALSEKTHPETSDAWANSRQIKLVPKKSDKADDNHNFKIMFNEWAAVTPDSPNENARAANVAPTNIELSPLLIEATFKPGYLTPDEFLWAVEMLLQKFKPKRLLIDN